jgi:hypothetical protein
MTRYRILRSALLLSAALTLGFTTAALAYHVPPPVPTPRLHQPVWPAPRPNPNGGVVNGGGGDLCVRGVGTCDLPYRPF